MAEYIDRQKAKRLFADRYDYGLARELDKIPAADVVEVVRCKDCKHCDPENMHCDHPMGTTLPMPRKPDEFCSYGERKDGE